MGIVPVNGKIPEEDALAPLSGQQEKACRWVNRHAST